MALATVNSFVCMFTGHVTSNFSIPVSWRAALAQTLLFAASTAMGLSFVGRKLNVVDRIAVLVFVSSISWEAVDSRVVIFALGTGFCALFAAWSYDRIRRRQAAARLAQPSD